MPFREGGLEDIGGGFVDGGVDDDEVGGKGSRQNIVATEFESDGKTVEGVDGIGELIGGCHVGDGDMGTLGGKPLGDTDAAAEATKAHDEDVFAGEGLWGRDEHEE